MSVLGIYFGTKNIYLVETEKKTFKNSVQIPWQKISGTEIEEKAPQEIKIVAVLENELTKNNISVKEASIALLGKELIIRTFNMPAIPQDELKSAMRFEAKKYIPFKLEELVYDFQVQFDTASRKNFILFAGIKKEVFDRYLNVLNQLKIKPSAIEYSGFSILRLLNLAGIKKKGGCALINIDLVEEDEVNFIILEKGLPLFSRDIILSPELPISPVVPGEIDMAAAILEKLKVELRISLDFYTRKFPNKGIKSIIFLAPDNLRPELEAFAKERGISTQFINVKKVINKPFLFSSGLFKAYTSSLAKRIKTDLKIDLLLSQDRLKGRKITGLEGKILTLFASLNINLKIVFIGLFVLVLPYIIDFYLKKPIQTELQEVISKRPEIEGVESSKGYEELNIINSDLKVKIKTITNLINSRLVVSELFDTLARIIPEGIWFRGLSLTKTDRETSFTLHCLAYLEDSDKELKVINRFLLNLKENPILNKNFKSIDIDSVDKGQTGEIILTNFVIVCRSQ